MMIRVERRKEPPVSLAERKRPFKADVPEALHDDFSGRCYLCEGIATGSFDVEHLRPKTDFPELEFEWTNLFPAHSRCNERRKTWSDGEREPGKKRWLQGGLLDCCADAVEGRLHTNLTSGLSGVVVEFGAAEPGDRAAMNTAAELNAIYSQGSVWGRQICGLVNTRYKGALSALEELRKALEMASDDWDADAVRDAASQVRHYLDPRGPYAGLIRGKFRHLLDPSWTARLSL